MKKFIVAICILASALIAFAKSPLEDVNFGTVYSRLEKISSDNYKDINSLLSILVDKNTELSVKLSAINLCTLNFASEKIGDKYLSKINIKKNKLKSKASYDQLIIYAYILAKENPSNVSGAIAFSNEACKKNKNSFSTALIASLIVAQNFYNTGDKDSAWAVINSVMQRPDWTYDMNLSAATTFNLSVLSYKNQNAKAKDNANKWFKGIYGNKTYVEPVVDVLAQNSSNNSSQSNSNNRTSTTNNSSPKLPALTMEEATEKDDGSSQITEGALPGKFSVSPTKAVRFSKGNLIKDTKKKEFSFADEQLITYATKNYYSMNEIITNFTRFDSGYKDLSGNVRDEKVMSQLDNIAGTNFDWGVFCKIKNGGNKEGLWRLLTDEEIYYLLYERKNYANLVSVGYVDYDIGLILLPDDWQTPPAGINFTPWYPDVVSSFANNYSYDQWQLMEEAGAVFLMMDDYWLSSAYDSKNSGVTGNVFCVTDEPYIEKSPKTEYDYPRSVRLVQDAGKPVDPKSIPELPKPNKKSVRISEYPTNNVLVVYEALYSGYWARKIVFYKNGTFWCPAREEYEYDSDEEAWTFPVPNRKYEAVGTYSGNPLTDNKITLNYYDKDVGQEILKRKSDGRFIDYIDVGVSEAITLNCIYKEGDKKTGKFIDEGKITSIVPQKVTGTPGSLGSVRFLAGIAEDEYINSEGMTIGTRFKTPAGLKRVDVKQGSYQEFLRNYRMYPSTHIGKYQSGGEQGATQVLEMDFIGKNVQECADVAMRLRCEYLFKTGQYDKISFHTSATSVWSYENYLKQNKVSVSEKSFRDYLEKLMSWAGSLSVDNYDTDPVSWSDVQIGDIIIEGGTPGHVVTIVDMAVSEDSDAIAVLLVQGFQPVQETEVVNGNWVYINELEPFDAGIGFTSENIKRYKIK